MSNQHRKNKKVSKHSKIDKSDTYIPKAFKKDKEIKRNKNNKKETKKRKGRKDDYIDDLDIDNKKTIKLKKKLKKLLFIMILVSILILGVISAIKANTWKNLVIQMLINENSIVLDLDGNEIAKIGIERQSKKIEGEKIPAYLKNAYVAIEDERFYSHGGVDIKRTGGAIISYITHLGSSSYGGSTITQQLVKNLTGDSADKISRKISEWWKACLLETFLSKDEILDAYLNIIYVGPNIYGVETGAKYYFNKSAKDLNLEECAFLAGINHSPNSYNPFNNDNDDNEDKIKTRTKTVLSKMLELSYINNEEYNIAVDKVNKGLTFENGISSKKQIEVYSYHTDALLLEVIDDLSKKYNISKTFATNYLNLAGLTINSSQNSRIQQQMETEFEKSKYSLESKFGGNSSQAAMVIVEPSTGRVVRMYRRVRKEDRI